MKIKMAKTIGFCKGVHNALSLAENAEPPTYILGDIIHNKGVKESLEKKGKITIDNVLQADTLPQGSVVIRAHGIGKNDYEHLIKSARHKIVDGTCPNVKHIKDVAVEYYQKGYKVILIGEANHPEMKGVNSWIDNSAIFINSEIFPKFDNNYRYIALVQTTFPIKKYENIIKSLKNVINLLVIVDTICYTTLCRQREAFDIAVESDMVFVIGDSTSANTKNLFDISRSVCPRTYLIEDINSLAAVDIYRTNMLGILAGASTPIELIMEVFNLMSNAQDENGIINAKESVEATADTSAAKEAAAATNEQSVTETVYVAEVENDKASEESVAVTDATAEEKKERVLILDAEEKVEPVVKAPKAKKKAAPKMTMADVMESGEGMNMSVRKGEIRDCSVVQVNDDALIISFGGKKEGYIAKEYICDDYKPEDFKVGDTFKAMVVEYEQKINDASGYITFDKRAVDERQDKESKALSGEKFTVKIERAVKGGVLSHVGSYLVFIPASQLQLKRVEDDGLEAFVGTEIEVVKMPDREEDEEKSKKNQKRLVASHKIILNQEWVERKEQREIAKREKEEKREQAKKDAFARNVENFKRGNVVEGVVKRFTAHGVFVNVAGFDCLCRPIEISWSKNKNPEGVFTLNEKYEFVIMEVDDNPERPQVSLSYRQLQPKPYELAFEKYPVGSIITGTVQKIESFGAFIAIEDGIDGLVHISNICHGKRISHPSEVLTVGQEVEAKVINFVDTKISLSIKACQPVPEKKHEVETTEITEDEYKQKIADRKASRESYFTNVSGVRDNKSRRDNRGAGRRSNTQQESNEPEIYTDSEGTITSTIGDLGFNLDDDDNK